jgi:predicted dehydrogenase
MLKIAVIGYGYWGPRLVRNFNQAPGAKVVMIVDRDPLRRQQAVIEWPGVEVVDDVTQALNGDCTDAVAIATPLSTHHAIGMAALKAGRHIFVEKPAAASVWEIEEMNEMAARANRVLMVDHTFIHTPALRRIREIIDSGSAGDIFYFESTRVNLGLFHHDTNVIWDLAVHDVSMMDYLLDENPVAVSATGQNHFKDQTENIAFLTIFFDGIAIAHVHVNWLAPVKVRRTLIGGSRQMVVYDDLEPSEKVKIYDKGVDIELDPNALNQTQFNYRSGDMWAPNLPGDEPLQNCVRHFIESIERNSTPITDGQAGLRVVRIIEAATQSMAQRGAPIELD